jgi:translation elongation factor EF-4
MEAISQLPLAEVLFDFWDHLQSITQGYGSVLRTEDDEDEG